MEIHGGKTEFVICCVEAEHHGQFNEQIERKGKTEPRIYWNIMLILLIVLVYYNLWIKKYLVKYAKLEFLNQNIYRLTEKEVICTFVLLMNVAHIRSTESKMTATTTWPSKTQKWLSAFTDKFLQFGVIVA